MKYQICLFLFHFYLIGFLAIQNGCKPKEDSLSDYQNNIIYGKIIGPEPCNIGSSDNDIFLIQILNEDLKIGSPISYFVHYDNAVEVINLPDELKKEGLEICFKFDIPEEKIMKACPANTFMYYLKQVNFIETAICDN